MLRASDSPSAVQLAGGGRFKSSSPLVAAGLPAAWGLEDFGGAAAADGAKSTFGAVAGRAASARTRVFRPWPFTSSQILVEYSENSRAHLPAQQRRMYSDGAPAGGEDAFMSSRWHSSCYVAGEFRRRSR